jgi:4'-phosphopantetheinyl transferase
MFQRPTTRNQHVVGRGMARKLLAEELPGHDTVEPQEIRFAAESHGKPYVTQPALAQRPFNVAHTDGLVMCGVGNESHELVGVDIERLERRVDLGLASRYFSQPEISFLDQIESEDAKRETFLRIWTLKESYIKAIGTGLQTPLADFAFDEIDSSHPKIKILNPALDCGRAWRFFAFAPRPGFLGAVAVATNQASDVTLELNRFEELVNE